MRVLAGHGVGEGREFFLRAAGGAFAFGDGAAVLAFARSVGFADTSPVAGGG